MNSEQSIITRENVAEDKRIETTALIFGAAAWAFRIEPVIFTSGFFEVSAKSG